MSTTTKLVSTACPTFFQAACHEATQGGADGYRAAAYALARHLSSLGPDDCDDAWSERITEGLIPAIMDENPSKVGGWFRVHLPQIAALVPSRQWPEFTMGLYRYVVEEGNDIAER